MHIEASDVTDYIDKCPAKRQDALRTLRNLVLSVDGGSSCSLQPAIYWHFRLLSAMPHVCTMTKAAGSTDRCQILTHPT